MLQHWTQNDLLVNGVRMHYYRTGHGDKRPLVLVHGFSDNGLCWAPTARDLESEYDVIMPDMRAHGLSERMKPGETVDMAADLAGLIRTLELKHPVICGHSMGAVIAFEIGVRFPELARALVLEDPPWRLSGPIQNPLSGDSGEPPIAKWAKNLSNQTLDELLAEYHVDHPDWTDAFIRTMCESKKQLDPLVVDTMVDKMHSQQGDWLTSIQRISQPVLLFTGSPALGAIVTPEIVAKIQQLNPKVTIVNVPDVGHLIRFDKYSVYMDALRVFLNQLL